MADYIKRRAVINAICAVDCEDCPDGGCDLYRQINRIKAADVRPVVRGHWVDHTSELFPADSTIECDQCHAEQPAGIDDNFCPNCGADMREPNLDTTKGGNHD